MRLYWLASFLTLLTVLAIGCSANAPELPNCPENFYDSETFRINYVHDDGDGEFYHLQYYIEIENITELIATLAVDAINPFSEVEIGELLALLADAELDANLDITPCDGGEGQQS